MKINIVQSNSFSGKLRENIRRIEETLKSEQSREALLTVFSANNLSGNPLSDMLEYADFHKELNAALQDCIALSEDHDAFIIGMPLLVQDKGLCNALVFIQNGAIRAVISKKNLREEEHKYFVKGDGFQIIQFHGENIAIGFYEDMKDLWKLGHEKPDTIICCASRVFDYTKPYKTFYKLQKTVEQLNVPLVFVNRVGGEGSLLFSGGSMALNAMGNILMQFPYFEEHQKAIDVQLFNDKPAPQKPEQIQLMHDALVMGIGDYFSKAGIKKAVLGLSGGIDSALVAALAVKALGPENVRGVLMPSEFSTSHSVSDSVRLAENLGIEYDVVSIKKAYDIMNELLQPVYGNKFDVTEENLQARLRAVILMAMSNKTGAGVLNTSNKSEVAVGYGTLYGDMCGALAVLGDLYKVQVYEMSEWINRDREIIPRNIIEKAPSAELRPNQKDSDSLPDYEILDEVLRLHIEEELGINEIVEEGFDRETVESIVRRVRSNEYKRRQAAPILKVSPKTFGIDRKIPLV